MYKKVGIVGLGLIGGSLCKALRNRCGVENIVAFNRSEDVLITAKSEGVINEYALEINEIFKDCDIVFICTPVDRIPFYAEKLVPIVGKSCVISDVGSTKEQIYNEMKPMCDSFIYIGGHPMAGSERFRYNASKEHLFENAYYIIAPAENAPSDKISEFKDMIEKIGAIPIIISPSEHDYVVASISHVPHIIAAALVNNVKKLDSEKGYMHLLAAGGFKDITRIASSSADMWESIMFENKNNIVSVLDSLSEVITNIKNEITADDHKDVYNYFYEAQQYRNSFNTTTPKAFVKRYEIDVDVLDRPGSIAIIAVLFSSNGINIKNMSIVNSRESNSGALNFAFDSEDDRQRSIELLRGMNYEVTVKD